MKIQPTTSAPKRQPLWLVRAMTTLYCKHIHRGSQLCQQCSDLIAFETQRSEQCCRDSGTSSCRECMRQCYPDAKRLEINHIIRWAEPKARWRKPIWIASRYVGSLLN